ncbi:hypothetical protein ACS0TY_008185 [Phlomoides rotata]
MHCSQGAHSLVQKMESLSYAFDSRSLPFTDDTDFPINGIVRNKHMLKKWDGEDAVGNIGFMEPPLPNVVKNPYLSDRPLGSLGKSAVMEFGTTLSSSLNKPNDEKFAAPTESNGNPSFIDNSVSPPLEPSVSAKRPRITNIQSPVPTCQVYGCNKDLSSSKDYHKRHKVCDVHSKTPVVTVNGIQQRFCQQCSRFQVLAEFDEGKRSCRKRLAGHNERRRKPQFDTHLGSTYISTDESKASMIFSRILPGGFVNLQYNDPTNHYTHIKLEEDVKFGHSRPKSVLCFNGVGKQYPSFCVSSDSGSALSLLSAQTHNVSRNSEEISTAHPLNHRLFTLEDSAVHLGEICTSENFIPLIPQESNALAYPSAEGPNTVNLLELSLHLQRVEQQKYYGQVKLENGIFCDSTMS